MRETLVQGVMVHSGSTIATSQANGSASKHTAALRMEHTLYPKESDIHMAIRARVGVWFVVLESVPIQRVRDFFASPRASVLELAHLDEVTQQQLQVPDRLPTRMTAVRWASGKDVCTLQHLHSPRSYLPPQSGRTGSD
jgi:hypothetical protein